MQRMEKKSKIKIQKSKLKANDFNFKRLSCAKVSSLDKEKLQPLVSENRTKSAFRERR